MPLTSGSSSKTLSANIAELMNSYKANGRIGNTVPENKDKAQKTAIAVAYAKRKESK